jgi:signal transduction histidine kinase
MHEDERKTTKQLLYELRLLRLENLRLRERRKDTGADAACRRQLTFLENTALIDETIRKSTDLSEMMTRLMDVVRAIFDCDQAWLLTPCDPDAPFWRVPYRSTGADFPIPFGPDDDIPVTPDLAENCRLALLTDEPVPLGRGNEVKDVPSEAREVHAKAALLITVHPKSGQPWMMGLHHCASEHCWTAEEKRTFQDISGRMADALSTTLFYRSLELNQDRLKHLSSQLFQAQEDERRRVAAEIHDDLSHLGLAVSMGLENALFLLGDGSAPRAENDQKEARRSLQSAASLAKTMVERMRHLQTSLYPPTLEDFGVIAALTGFLANFRNIYKDLHVDWRNDLAESDIPAALHVTLFRLAQEGLSNAARHSLADTATLSMNRTRDALTLTIEDNGVGFDPARTLQYPDKRLGLGLTSMRERVEMTGGTLTIRSALGRGTVIRAMWPLPPAPLAPEDAAG